MFSLLAHPARSITEHPQVLDLKKLFASTKGSDTRASSQASELCTSGARMPDESAGPDASAVCAVRAPHAPPPRGSTAQGTKLREDFCMHATPRLKSLKTRFKRKEHRRVTVNLLRFEHRSADSTILQVNYQSVPTGKLKKFHW